MSARSRTQAPFIQGKQSTVDQDAPHSALIYLFQEVSRLASPIHDRGAPFMVKEDRDAQSFSLSNSSCQHSLSCLSNYNQTEQMKEDSHSSKDTTLVHPQCNSPWKVLRLINLQCDRLLNPGDVQESDQNLASSVTKLGNSADKALTETEQGSNVPNEMHKVTAAVSSGTDVSGVCSRKTEKPQCCAKKDSQIGVQSELVEGEVPTSSLTQPGYTEEDKFSESRQISLKQECNNSFSFAENTFNVLVAGNTSSSKLTFNEKEETSEIQSKPALTLDHNANITFTPELQSDKPLPSLSVILSAAQSLLFNTAENDQSHSQQDDKLAAATPGCFNTPSEVEFPSVALPEPSSDSGKTNLSDSASPDLKSRSEHQEEAAPLSAQTWRTKTPRKQRYPSKSVDIQDPNFQGVTFRMDTELDDSKEQCRLLITSKYSREFRKSVRKPRLRTRTALKSLKTISSEEESDPGTRASKGKVCASCCTRKTPMWRDAEDGTPLCNACGIRFKKYKVRCVNCWHIPRKESNSNSCCLKCGNSLKLTSAHRKHSA